MGKKIRKITRKIHKPRTSKVLLWIFVILFISVIYKCMSANYESIQDTAVYVTIIGSLSSILALFIVHYLNNSNSENIPRIQLGLYKDSMEIRLRYNEEMLKLKQEYGATDEDISEIEGDFNLDEVADSVLDNTISELNDKSTKAHEDVSANI